MPDPLVIAECINILKLAFPNFQPDVQKTADLWVAMFSDFENDTLKAAVTVCLTEKRAFAPSIGEIRAAAMDLHAQAAGIPDAFQAYEEVCKMPGGMETTHVTDEYDDEGRVIIDVHKLVFTHPVVESTARALGWPKTFPTDNPGVDRGQFVKAYNEELTRLMHDAGRLPVIQRYIESKRPQMQGGLPMLRKAAKQLTGGLNVPRTKP